MTALRPQINGQPTQVPGQEGLEAVCLGDRGRIACVLKVHDGLVQRRHARHDVEAVGRDQRLHLGLGLGHDIVIRDAGRRCRIVMGTGHRGGLAGHALWRNGLSHGLDQVGLERIDLGTKAFDEVDGRDLGLADGDDLGAVRLDQRIRGAHDGVDLLRSGGDALLDGLDGVHVLGIHRLAQIADDRLEGVGHVGAQGLGDLVVGRVSAERALEHLDDCVAVHVFLALVGGPFKGLDDGVGLLDRNAGEILFDDVGAPVDQRHRLDQHHRLDQRHRLDGLGVERRHLRDRCLAERDHRRAGVPRVLADANVHHLAFGDDLGVDGVALDHFPLNTEPVRALGVALGHALCGVEDALAFGDAEVQGALHKSHITLADNTDGLAHRLRGVVVVQQSLLVEVRPVDALLDDGLPVKVARL